MSNFIITNEQRSKAGKTAAANMTAEERRERAIKASHGRKSMRDLPKATHSGDLTIGDTTISCAVLEDGRRLITETSMFEILDRKRFGRSSTEQLPRFLAANNLKPLITNDLECGAGTITFIPKNGRKAYGYEAKIIPEICKIYLDARDLGILTPSQMPTAKRAQVILHSLATIGIISLIDEATSYQEVRENSELQILFNKFIAKELQPWTKKFPNEFFTHIKRMYSLEHLKGNPQFIGHLINRYIYGEISYEILEEIKEKNPTNEKGLRSNRHHQFLTEDVGHPALNKQIMKINTLLSVSDSKEDFEVLFEKTKRRIEN